MNKLEKEYFLGVDVGSVSTNLVLMDQELAVRRKLYLKTGGRPADALRHGLALLKDDPEGPFTIRGAGATGSGRQLASLLIGADVVKNEITAHAVAACTAVPGVRTVLEIGGQDSKIILLKDGVVCDFAMNTVCAAGTGSFLDRQASRLDIPIEEFGGYALRAKNPVRIAGRCAVFAESDMIHKQQSGHSSEDIIAGLCEALARNYLNNLAKGRRLEGPILFQGGVAANVGISAAFERLLGHKLIIPAHYDVMGAYGSAILAREELAATGGKTVFCGFESLKGDFTVSTFQCDDCPNQCEVVRAKPPGRAETCWGDRCGKWSAARSAAAAGRTKKV